MCLDSPGHAAVFGKDAGQDTVCPGAGGELVAERGSTISNEHRRGNRGLRKRRSAAADLAAEGTDEQQTPDADLRRSNARSHSDSPEMVLADLTYSEAKKDRESD